MHFWHSRPESADVMGYSRFPASAARLICVDPDLDPGERRSATIAACVANSRRVGRRAPDARPLVGRRRPAPARAPPAAGVGATEGADRRGRARARDRAPRGLRGDRPQRARRPQARRRPLRLHVGGRADLQDRLVLPPARRRRADRRPAARDGGRGRRGSLGPARRRPGRALLRRRARDGGACRGCPRGGFLASGASR